MFINFTFENRNVFVNAHAVECIENYTIIHGHVKLECTKMLLSSGQTIIVSEDVNEVIARIEVQKEKK